LTSFDFHPPFGICNSLENKTFLIQDTGKTADVKIEDNNFNTSREVSETSLVSQSDTGAIIAVGKHIQT
jgi:hypothetical protein